MEKALPPDVRTGEGVAGAERLLGLGSWVVGVGLRGRSVGAGATPSAVVPAKWTVPAARAVPPAPALHCAWPKWE